VIRFSAALVAVAIGVLIGGIATSELVLVYIAIVVSAVALAVLAIGVMLKRDELFGEGQGLVPAGAGTGPVLSAQAEPQLREYQPVGSQRAQATPFSQVTQRSVVTQQSQVTPSLPVRESAAAPSVGAFRADTARAEAARADLAARAEAARVKEAARTAAASPWETPAATSTGRGSWAPAHEGRPDWTRTAAAQAPAQAPSPVLPAPVAPAPAPEAPAPEPATQATPASWFERLGEPASNAWSVPSSTPSPAEPATSAADEDEPVRYSWLEDLDDDANDPSASDSADNALGESAEPLAGEPTAAVAALTPDWSADVEPGAVEPADSGDTLQADEAIHRPEPAEVADAEVAGTELTGTVITDTEVTGTVITDTEVTGTVVTDTEVTDTEVTGTVVTDTVVTDTEVTDTEVTDTEVADDEVAGAEVAGTVESPGSDEVTDTADPADTEPPAAGQAAAEVAVVRGVPRYHEPDCVLIRFMPEADTQRMSIPDAKSAGCTPCAACQPAG
jgi:hypothetical protein